jgi:hypothetical protein
MHCNVAEKGGQGSPKGDALNVPLPWPDKDFDAGVCRQPPVFMNTEGGDFSIAAEFVRVMSIW